MSTIKYRIPDTNLYLTADGRFSPRVYAGERAVPLSPRHAHIVESA